MIKGKFAIVLISCCALLLGCSKRIGMAGSKEPLMLELRPDAAAGKDAILWNLKPDQNYGSHPQIISCAWTNQGRPSMLRAVFSFDLSVLPKKASIESATLYLYHHLANNNPGHAGENAAFIRRITEPWDEQEVSWNTQPATTTINQVVVEISKKETENYAIDITQLLSDSRANPAESFGFLVQQTEEVYYRSLAFASSDVADEQIRPKLVIVYSFNKKKRKLPGK